MQALRAPRLAPLALAALTCALGGCDSEPGSTLDYEAVAHVEIQDLAKAPWIASALKAKPTGDAAEFAVCQDALLSAESLTVGTGNHAFELYLQGSLDRTAIDGCVDALEEAKRKAPAAKTKMQTRTKWLAADLFAISGAEGTAPTPSAARLESLLASDPTPAATPSSAWLVARDDEGKESIAHVEAWADVAKGLDAHVDVEFDSTAEATKIYGQAMLGMTAMRASGEAKELLDAVKLSSGGDTLTLDVHATAKQLATVGAKISANASTTEGDAAPTRKPSDSGHSFQISIGTSD
jgi:hypothetical protein